MWLRARRPAMEKALGDVWSTLKASANYAKAPIAATVETNLPGFGYKVLGVVGLLLGYNISVAYVTSRTEAWMFLEKMRLYALGDELVKKGFFMSDAEEADKKDEAYTHTAERLNALWETAIANATHSRSFDKLCEHIAVDEAANPIKELPKPIQWRFSMMP